MLMVFKLAFGKNQLQLSMNTDHGIRIRTDHLTGDPEISSLGTGMVLESLLSKVFP